MQKGYRIGQQTSTFMKTISLKKLTAILMVSAGVITVESIPSMAQSTSGQNNSATSNTNNKNKNNQSASGQKMQGKAMNSANIDAAFIKKASEGNLAEVELGKMALQKATSQEVKDFAQQMIDHHSKANEKLVNIMSGSAGMSSNSMRDQNIPSTDDNSGNAGMATNKKSGSAGSGNVSSNPGNMSDNTADDANMNDNDQQSTSNQSISSRTNDNTADGNTQGNSRTNDPERNVSDGTGGGGAGANSGGTTSSMSTSRVGGTDMNEGPTDNTGATANEHNTSTSDQTGLHGDSGNLRTSTGGASSMHGTSGTGNGGFDNPIATTLSAEHVAVKNKLSGLSGEAFDKEYMQAMVKDHAKTVELFETQIKKGQQTEVVNFAKNGLPMIREHYQKAQALSGTKGNMNKGSSTNKGSSGSN